jgi:hypothetical protein
MTTTFENPLALLRQLKGAPLSVYMACLIVRQVVTHHWCCEQTGYTEHAVTTALAYLTAHNFLTRVTGGWMVATAAQLPLMYEQLEPGLEGSNIAINAILGDEYRDNRESCPLKKERIYRQENENDPSFFLNGENRDNRDFEETDQPAAQEPVLPGVQEILVETGDLFGGQGVYLSGIDTDNLQPHDVLGWLAQAWDQWVDGGRRGRLHSPVQFVYKKLIADPFAKPALEYELDWRRVLPDDWLERFGLVEYRCQVCDETRSTRSEYERHLESHPACEVCDEQFLDPAALDEHLKSHKRLTKNKSVTEPIEGGMSAERAWNAVLGQLQLEMPPGSFATWVRDTEALDFDGKNITVGVRNAYARDWLENRLTGTVNRLLVGITNAFVYVEFVTDESEQP